MASETLKTPEVKEKKAQGERDRKKKMAFQFLTVQLLLGFYWLF